MLDLTFNTSRLYTAEGQVIRATFDPETGEVLFDDFSRMISGRYNVTDLAFCRAWWPDHIDLLAKSVMRHYDEGTYDWARARGRPDGEPVKYHM